MRAVYSIWFGLGAFAVGEVLRYLSNDRSCGPEGVLLGWTSLFVLGFIIGWFDYPRKQRKEEEKRKRQEEQERTNDLMREYLKKKLQEENDKQE